MLLHASCNILAMHTVCQSNLCLPVEHCNSCRGVMDWNFAPTSKCSEVLLTDMGYPIDPHSLYKAIGWASQLKVPMYIMENGGPFDKDDTRRTKWINGALEQVVTLQ